MDGLAQDECMTIVRWRSCCVVGKTSYCCLQRLLQYPLQEVPVLTRTEKPLYPSLLLVSVSVYFKEYLKLLHGGAVASRRWPSLRLWPRRVQKSHLFEWPSLATFHYPPVCPWAFTIPAWNYLSALPGWRGSGLTKRSSIFKITVTRSWGFKDLGSHKPLYRWILLRFCSWNA